MKRLLIITDCFLSDSEKEGTGSLSLTLEEYFFFFSDNKM
jgi:hypothetical protein